MRTSRPKAPLVVSAEERECLEDLARRRKTSQAQALRARIVLACAEGRFNDEVAKAFGVLPQTVGKWRRRFAEKRLEGLLDEPRPGVPRKIGDAEVRRVVTLTLEDRKSVV